MKYLNEITLQAWCKLRSFTREEKGASGIEYVLIATMVAVVIAGFLGLGEGSISGEMKTILGNIKEALAPSTP